MCVFSVCIRTLSRIIFFFFNDTATTEIYTLSLHDALPISDLCRTGRAHHPGFIGVPGRFDLPKRGSLRKVQWKERSEEHTSELQSQSNLVCRLLLEKKKKKSIIINEIQTVAPAGHTLSAQR